MNKIRTIFVVLFQVLLSSASSSVMGYCCPDLTVPMLEMYVMAQPAYVALRNGSHEELCQAFEKLHAHIKETFHQTTREGLAAISALELLMDNDTFKKITSTDCYYGNEIDLYRGFSYSFLRKLVQRDLELVTMLLRADALRTIADDEKKIEEKIRRLMVEKAEWLIAYVKFAQVCPDIDKRWLRDENSAILQNILYTHAMLNSCMHTEEGFSDSQSAIIKEFEELYQSIFGQA